MSIVLSFASLNFASGKLYFSQRASVFFNSDPPLKNIIFVSPLISVLQFGYLASWIFLVAYLKVWSVVCTILILLIYFIMIKSLVERDNAILCENELQVVNKETVDIADIFSIATFTAIVCPCTVWHEPIRCQFHQHVYRPLLCTQLLFEYK